MLWVSAAKYIDEYKLWIRFNNEIEKIVDLKNHLTGEIFEPLNNIEYFKTVKFNPEIDTITWENGADFAPEFLYEIGE